MRVGNHRQYRLPALLSHGDEFAGMARENSMSQYRDESSPPDGPAKPTPFRSPVQFFAFGFGSGLSPVAPGTAGTIMAIPLYLLMADLPLWQYSVVIIAASLVGFWFCGEASRQLGVHDHGGIVWDEFVGYWITLWAMPFDWLWVVAGFVVFRVFDIAKPWPIGWLDRKVHGGLGIMVDDMVAGIMACATLHVALWLST
jgi:phosphatidylglycerophosphatase A